MSSSKNKLAAATSLIALLASGSVFAQALPVPTPRAAVAPAAETLEVDGKKLQKGWLVEVKPMIEKNRSFSAVDDLTLFSYNAQKIDFDGRVSAPGANGIFGWTSIAFEGYAKTPDGQFRIAARTNAEVVCNLAVDMNGQDALAGRMLLTQNNPDFKQRVESDVYPGGEIVHITGTLVCEALSANSNLKGKEIAFEIGDAGNFQPLFVYSERAAVTTNVPQRAPTNWMQVVENRGNTTKTQVSPSFMPMPTEPGLGFKIEGRLKLPAGKHALFVVANAGSGAISQGCAMKVYVPTPRIDLVNLVASEAQTLHVNAPGGYAPQRTPVFAASVEISKEAAAATDPIPLNFELEPSCVAGGSGGRNQHMSVMLKLEGEHNWRNITAKEAQ